MTDPIMRGKYALITGASSGLGADFARDLAARGMNLILVARREDLLQKLREEIAARHGVGVEVISLDLTAPDAPRRLYDHLKEAGKAVEVLVNNAGFGLHGQFIDIPWERERNMLELDIITLVHLTKLFIHDMVARDSGYILQIASNGAFQPTPTYASYAAAKSFVLNFGEALNYELRKTNVSCTVLSPGVTATEFLRVSGQRATLYQRRLMMRSADVVRIGVEGMFKRRSSVVPGRLNSLVALSTRLIPRRLATALSYRAMTA